MSEFLVLSVIGNAFAGNIKVLSIKGLSVIDVGSR